MRGERAQHMRPRVGIFIRLLAGLLQLRAQPRHLHSFQQGLQASVQADTLQVARELTTRNA